MRATSQACELGIDACVDTWEQETSTGGGAFSRSCNSVSQESFSPDPAVGTAPQPQPQHCTSATVLSMLASYTAHWVDLLLECWVSRYQCCCE